MEVLLELPECPVCLQSYDSKETIPRVLSCGHTVCESCLKNLPQKYSLTVCCPACTQLVKYPSQGPSFLPRNIDLLKLIPTCQNPDKPLKQSQNDHPQDDIVDFVPPLWSDEFYAKWKNWVLSKDAVLVGEEGNGDGCLREGNNRKVRLFKVGLFDVINDGSGCVFKLSYAAKVMNFLYEMKEEEREELGLVLKVCSKLCKICKVYGLWGDLEDGFLYLVCERLKGTVLEKLDYFEDGFREDGLSIFKMMSMEICEAVISLHLEGLNIGCLGLSCFELDDFGHISFSLCEVLMMGRMVRGDVLETGSGGIGIGDKTMGLLFAELLKREAFVSPEVFFEILKKEGMEVGCGSFRYAVAHSSDVWSLACVLFRLLFGKQFIEVMIVYVDHHISKIYEENGLNCLGLYSGVMNKVSALFGSKVGTEFETLQQILCSCLSFDPTSRPLVIDVWKSIRELIIRLQFDTMLKLGIHEKNQGYCLVLGELCWVPKKRSEPIEKDELQRAENSDKENLHQVEGVKVDNECSEGPVEGKLKFKVMQGHLDCVTGLAIGGGFLFSSSFDKSVHVWSLQDFSHIHRFKGHEHKVMAVIYVDEEQPLCISGDSGGGIFLWSIGDSNSLGQEPLKKWYEQKDWRYSGIHALTTAENGYLYTGSGDRSIKAWSLQDGTLSCTMEGHKSVVSTLTARNGILYSGSWDGTIRLWSLSDHSLLTVLGEDVPGAVTSILSLVANQNILVAAHENGHIKVWRNDVFMKTIKLHDGAIFAISMDGKWLFTGGWDKTVHVQELSGDEFQVDARPIGSIPGVSVITTLLCWQGKLFVGFGDKTVKFSFGPAFGCAGTCILQEPDTRCITMKNDQSRGVGLTKKQCSLELIKTIFGFYMVPAFELEKAMRIVESNRKYLLLV